MLLRFFAISKLTRHAKNRMRMQGISEDVSKKMSLKDIANITIENLPVEPVETSAA